MSLSLHVLGQTVIGGLSMGCVYALVALGFSLVYRAMGLVNFAHGDIFMIGAYFGVVFFMRLHLPFVAAFVLGVAATGLLGAGFERVLRPLEDRDLMLMLLGTLGIGIVLDNVAQLVWGTEGVSVPVPIRDRPWHVAGIAVMPYTLVMVLVAAALLAGLYLFLERTAVGTALRASAQDREVAMAMGINVHRCNMLAFAVGSALAAAAGILVGPVLYVNPTMGASVGIKGFAAAILGGFGNLPGAVVGGLLFGLIEGLAASQNSAYSEIIAFLVFTVVLVVRPTGLLGERTVDRV
jgi:branched-chain amino acid transport system permease protein